jgi:signal transduction histidine kinase/ligand-binding sensor domain-containing protein
VFSAGIKNVPGHRCRSMLNLKRGNPSVARGASSAGCLMARSVRLWAFLWIALTSIPAMAQYRFDAWTADNGLPQNIIRGMHQTPDGYLWIATLDGISRFDGVHFTIFNKNNTPGIVSNRIGSMVGGQGGDLWLSSEGGRVIRYHNGEFKTYGEGQGLPEGEPTHGLAADDSGAVWVLFVNAVARWDEGSGRFIIKKLGFPQVRYKDLRWGHLGFWGTDGKKLEYFVKDRLVQVSLPAWLPGSSIWEAAIDQSGTIWLETFNGKHITLKDGTATVQPGNATLDYIDRQGHTWKMRVGHQLDRSLEGVSSGANAPRSFSQVTEDRENSLWIGTEGQGLYRLQRQSVRMMSKEQGLVDRNVYPIYQDRSGAVWVSAWNSGLSRFAAGKFTSYTVSNGLPNPLISALYEDREGRLWIATHGGNLRIFVNGRLQKPEGPALAEDTLIQAIYQDKEGSLWFGTSQGLVKYSHGLTRTFTTHDGLATNDIHVIIGGTAGDIWFGGYGGLARLHAGVLAPVVAADLSATESIRSLYEDVDGVLWIGTYDNGLARLKDGKFTRYTVADGLFNNGAFQILEDAHSNLWMSSNRGIYRVSKQDLNDFAANRQKVITSIAYGTIDGMLNAECNGGLSPAGIKTQDGKMWFPTQNGVAIVDPEAVPRNLLAPPVVIESSVLDHVRLADTASMKIPPGRTNLEIQYTALSFIKSDQIQFRYKMEGLDTAWVDAGSRRIAYYSHLPPGRYSFQVIAGNSDGVWNTVGQRIAIEVLAPFYRTWQFLTFLFFVAAGLIWAAANYRVTRLKHAQHAQQVFSQQLIASQEGERKRIAGELHDSLGQRLVVINNLALFFLRAHRRLSQDEDQVESIREISTEATLAIEETRSIAYDLRPFQLDRLGLTKSLESLIRTVSKSSQIDFTTDLANIDDLFPEELRINFYRIVQEALSNIMKHAQATEGAVHISRTQSAVTLSVKDNGRGFVQGPRVSQIGNGGFGITGMAERAGLLGGRLTMRSLPSGGTVMSVEISLEGARHAT